MFDSITVYAPAKINLGLRVLPKRDDGYHNIESIFTTVSLADELQISLTNQKNKCSVACEGMVLPPENTFTSSYKAFCVLTGCDCGVSVKVTKHIPSGGGLGGGSSDASSFIQSIDKLCRTHLTAENMVSLAGSVGSDVYFFTNALLASGGESDGRQKYAAFITGRGEHVEQIQCRDDYAVLLVFPDVSVSTKEAYSLVDESNSVCIKSVGGQKKKAVEIYEKPVRTWSFVNDFTKPVCERFSKVNEALEAVKKTGADFADMSGSGSTVFGVYEEREAALQALHVLNGTWQSVLA